MSLELALTENTKALNLVAGLLQEFVKGPGITRIVPGVTVAGSVPKFDGEPIDVTKITDNTPLTKKSAPPAAAPPEETVSAAAPSAEPSVPAQADAELTPEELRKELSKLIPEAVKAGKKPAVLAVLQEFGATMVPKVKDADLSAVLAKVKAL